MNSRPRLAVLRGHVLSLPRACRGVHRAGNGDPERIRDILNNSSTLASILRASTRPPISKAELEYMLDGCTDEDSPATDNDVQTTIMQASFA